MSDSDLNKTHEAGLAILENLGVKIEHSEVYRRVIEAGAKPGATGTVVYLPRELVMSCVAQCPKTIALGDRNGDIAYLSAREGIVYFTGNALNWTDASGVVHPITKMDFCDYIRLIDSLDNVFGMVGTCIADVPVKARDVTGFRLMLEHTGKHLRPCLYSAQGAKRIIEMADIVLDGSPYETMPFFSLGYSIVSPLHWTQEACEIFLQTAGRKIPLTVNSEPMAGGTSPVTLAGSLALGNAEVLSGIVINQILEPGRPLFYNMGFAHLLDMYTATALTGAPESGLMAAAGAELAAFYGLPCTSWFGTDTFTVDTQAVMEKMLTIFTHAAGGANFIWGVGNIEATKCYSPVMAVLDNEMIGATERYRRGIEFNEETLALDAIYEVGFGGDFLSSEHTFKHFRAENRYDILGTRGYRERWERDGSLTMEQKAAQVVEDVLSRSAKHYLEGKKLEQVKRLEREWLEMCERM